MEKRAVFVSNAAAKGKFYSDAIKAGSLVFVSGQGPIDEITGRVKGTTFKEQVSITLQNLGAVLETAGSSIEKVCKVNAYLKDIESFDEFNEIYIQFFGEPRPARTTVSARLSGDILVEIDAIAII